MACRLSRRMLQVLSVRFTRSTPFTPENQRTGYAHLKDRRLGQAASRSMTRRCWAGGGDYRSLGFAVTLDGASPPVCCGDVDSLKGWPYSHSDNDGGIMEGRLQRDDGGRPFKGASPPVSFGTVAELCCQCTRNVASGLRICRACSK